MIRAFLFSKGLDITEKMDSKPLRLALFEHCGVKLNQVV
jgi:hypothetical protein